MSPLRALLAFAAVAAVGVAPAQQPVLPAAAGAPCKVCVPEPQPKTRTVYMVRCEPYCRPACSLWAILCGRGCCEAACEPVQVRKMLVKKKVPDGETLK